MILRKIKNLNYPLIIGVIMVLIIVFITLNAGEIIQIDPYAINLGDVSYEDGEIISKKPPLPPNEVNILGTDILGRDLYSQIIYGTRLTLTIGILVTIFRLIVALPFAFFAGFGERVASKIIDLFSTSFSSIPALVVSIIILNFSVIKNMELNQSIIAFTIVLTFVGWGRLAKVLRDRIKDILNQKFILGEIAVGKSKIMIALQNVLPHLTATIIIYMFLEMSRALFLLAQLGVFGIYVGKNKIDPVMIYNLKFDILPSYEPEWGALLGASRYAIITGKLWLAFYPAVAFFISILAFNLLGEGLKIEVNRRNSRVISWIKKIPYYISPKTYLYELEDYKKYWKPVIVKTIVIVLILAVILSPVPRSILKVDADTVYSHVKEISKSDYKGRLMSTEGRDKAAEYIVNELRKVVGAKPLFDNEYYQEIKRDVVIGDLQSSEMYILKEDGTKVVQFEYKKDYNFNIRKECFDGKVKAKILTQEQFDKGEYNKDELYFVVMDENYDYWQARRNRDETIYKLLVQNFIIGVFVPFKYDNEFISNRTIFEPFNITGLTSESDIYIFFRFMSLTVPVTDEAAYVMRGFAGKELVIENEMNVIDNITLKNIGCIIESPNPKEETLIIATNYDYLGYEKEDKYKGLLYNGTSISAALEITKKLAESKSNLNRNVIILFFDGSMYPMWSGSKIFMERGYKLVNEDSMVITFNNLGLKGRDTLFLDASLVSTGDKRYFEYIKYIENRARELGISVRRDKLIAGDEDIENLCKYGASGLYFQCLDNIEQYKYYKRPQNDIKLIDKEILEKQTQLILDTIVHISYINE